MKMISTMSPEILSINPHDVQTLKSFTSMLDIAGGSLQGINIIFLKLSYSTDQTVIRVKGSVQPSKQSLTQRHSGDARPHS